MAYRIRILTASLGLALGLTLLPVPAAALDSVDIRVTAKDEDLREALRAASAVKAAQREERTAASDIFAAALAEYAAMTEALYANGFYGGTVSVRIDGAEAANIPLLRIPSRIDKVTVLVDPGPKFRFGSTELTPVAPGTALPEDFRPEQVARSGIVGDTVDAAITGWRDAGHAKARPTDTNVVANHNRNRLNVDIRVDPGPRVTFGDLNVTTQTDVKKRSIRRIAGLPTGAVFSPEALRTSGARLRRVSAFSSVTLTEGEVTGPDNRMDIGARIVDEKPRRFGFGAEISSLEGLTVSGFWLHRNLLGGAERLRFDAAVGNIGGTSGSGIDYSLKGRLEVPAIYGPDTIGFLFGDIAREDEPTYISNSAEIGIGATRMFDTGLELEVAVSYLYSDTEDDLRDRTFSLLTFPITATYDRRDDPLNPTSGYYAKLALKPYADLGGDQGGARLFTDLRGYYDLREGGQSVLAGRLQLGSVMGSDLTQTNPEFLFSSGGGGTVRGQPYKSLDVDLGGGARTGGRSFVGVSAEFRQRITDSIGAVAFADTGYIGAESFYDGTGQWHSGAGLGLRYNTGIGPIRFDVAGPVSGDTSDGVQIYIGIGQAF